MKLNQVREQKIGFTIRVGAGLPIGVLPLGVFVPNNSIVQINFEIRIVTDFLSGGAATMDIGTVTDPNAILAAASIASLAQGGANEGGIVTAAQLITTVGEELIATVVAFAYTAGELNGVIRVTTFPTF